MKANTIAAILLLLLSGAVSSIAQVKNINITSPDKSIIFSLTIIGNQPKYSISTSGSPAISSSAIGFKKDGKIIGPCSSFRVFHRESENESHISRGVHSVAMNKYNQVLLNMGDDVLYQFEIKVFNDGVAFRYLVPDRKSSVVSEDLTSFQLPAGSIVWSQSNITTYEGNYLEQKIEDVKIGQVVGPPLTAKLAKGKGYVAITEAGLTDFAGMSLVAAGSNTFNASLVGLTHKAETITTPWRVILIGATLNRLVNSDIIANVSPKPDPKLFPNGPGTSWIKPGKSVWSWLAGNGEVTIGNMKRFSDWAAELGFDYNLVDEGWSKWKDGNKDQWALMKELVDYSKNKGIKIWAWKAYPDRDGDPGLQDAATRIAYFKKCKSIGIVGLKLDFFDIESQNVIKFYQAALKDAASVELMLDFHGSNKPTGESRTWPNEMSREGILGLEGSANWAKHNTTLVFTRFLAGHADYTPLTLGDNAKGTTLVHQVATVAAFTSPFMCLGVNPEALIHSEVKTTVQKIPVTWDETVILPQSRIGELVLMARRKGKEWFLIALNGEAGQSVKVSLNFLNKGEYSANLLYDSETKNSGCIEKIGRFNYTNTIELTLANGGGFLGRFYK